MNKALGTLGMCKCANKTSYGETLISDIRNHNVFLVVISLDTSANSKKKIMDKCAYYKCECIEAFTQDEVMKVLARIEPVSAVGIKDRNLAKKLKENIESEAGANG